jgi:MFS family permease
MVGGAVPVVFAAVPNRVAHRGSADPGRATEPTRRAPGRRASRRARTRSVRGDRRAPGPHDDSQGRRLGTSFNRLFVASTVSNLGDGMLVVALPLLAVSITDSPLQIALLTVCRGVPWLAFGLTAGVIGDRSDRRRLMAFVDYGRALIVGLLALAVLVSDVPMWVLFLTALGLGAGEVLFDSSSGAFLPMIVPEHHLERANARLHLSLTLANELSGPVVGAWLFAVAAAAPFIVDAGSFVFAATAVLAIGGSYRVAFDSDRRILSPLHDDLVPAVGPRMREQIREGLQFLRGHPLLRTLAIVGSSYNFLATGLSAIAVLYVRTELGASELQYGIVLTLAAVGGLVGAFAAPKVYERFSSGHVIVIDIVVCALVAFAAAAIGELWAWAVFDTVLFGGSAIASIGSRAMRQRAMPPELAGRLTSVFLLLLFGAGPLGAALFGGLAAATSPGAALVAFGIGSLCIVAGFGRSLASTR